MSGYDWNFSVLAPFADAFWRGAAVTLALSVLSFVGGTVAGFAAAIALRGVPGATLIFLVNDAVRALPPLVLLFLAYFFPTRELLGVAPLSPFWTSVVALGLSQAAYTADLTRAAIDQVPKTSLLAGHAIGLSRSDLWRFVILPDVARQTAAPQLAFFIGIVRLSSLASVIGCQEVVYVSRIVSAQTFRSFEPWILVSAIYIAMILPLTALARRFESSRWLARRG